AIHQPGEQVLAPLGQQAALARHLHPPADGDGPPARPPPRAARIPPRPAPGEPVDLPPALRGGLAVHRRARRAAACHRRVVRAPKSSIVASWERAPSVSIHSSTRYAGHAPSASPSAITAGTRISPVSPSRRRPSASAGNMAGGDCWLHFTK